LLHVEEHNPENLELARERKKKGESGRLFKGGGGEFRAISSQRKKDLTSSLLKRKFRICNQPPTETAKEKGRRGFARRGEGEEERGRSQQTDL